MPESKVTSIRQVGTWNSQNGPMYTQEVAFEDGMVGQANSKEPTPWYKIGDMVEYTKTGEYQGQPKLSIKKIGGGNFRGGSGGGGGGDSVGAMVGNAINNAVLLICHNKAKPAQGETLGACVARLADQICTASDTLKKKWTPAKPAPQPQQAQPQQGYQQPAQGYHQQPQQPQQPTNQAQQGSYSADDDDVPF